MMTRTSLPTTGLWAWLALGLFSVLGCGDQLSPEYALPELNRAVFQAEVQPILAARCGNPSTCHGDEARPFAIYVRGANRLNPTDIYLDPPITVAELEANFNRTRAFALDDGRGAVLLSKPLAERVGGAGHSGGDVFFGVDDREYKTLLAWIEGQSGGADD